MKIRNNIIWFVTVFIVLFFNTESNSQNVIKDVRWGFHENYIKLVFEFSSQVKFDFAKGEKLSLKFKNCDFGIYDKRKIEIKNLILKDIELKKSGKDIYTIINTRDSYKYKTPYVIENPYRIVMDFYYEVEKEDNYTTALKYEEKGDYKTALDYYRKAVRQNPDDYDSYFRAGILRYKIGDFDKAIINFRQVPEYSPYWEEASEYIAKIKNPEPVDKNKKSIALEVKNATGKISKKEEIPNETVVSSKKPEKEINSFIELNNDSDNLSQNFGSLVDFGKYYLYLFIGISIIFLFLLFLLIRKYFGLKREQNLYINARKSTEKSESEADKKENIHKRVDFTKKLLEVYQATEESRKKLKKEPVKKHITPKKNEDYKPWNEKIDRILKYENESVKLTRKFRENGSYSGGKYEAVDGSDF